MRTRRNEWPGRLAGLLLGVGLCAAAEVALRLGGFSFGAPRDFRFIGKDPVNDAKQHVRDDTLFWRLRPGAPVPEDAALGAVINDDGFRGPRLFPALSKRVLRVVAVGESSTYGVGVPYRHTYVGRAAALLADRLHRPVSILNAGCHGYSTYQGLMLLRERILRLEPDLLTIYFGAWNDFTPAIGESDAHKPMAHAGYSRGSSALAAVKHLRLFQAIRGGISSVGRVTGSNELAAEERERYLRAFREGEPPEGRRVPLSDFKGNLREMVDLARASGISVLLITPPLSEMSQEEFPVYHQYRDVVREVGSEAVVPVVEAADALAEEEMAGGRPFSDWVHPSIEGHEVIAQSLATSIERLLADGRGDPESARRERDAMDAGRNADEEVVNLLDYLHEAKIQTPASRYVVPQLLNAGAVGRHGLFMHPLSRVSVPVAGAGVFGEFILGFALSDAAIGQGVGDGVSFVASLQTSEGAEAVIFAADVDPFRRVSDRGWHDHRIPVALPLSPTPLRLVLETTPGPRGNPDFDWAGWSPVRVRVWR